ncbi:unnamed protein product [Paramecium sonneborni]|uniref:Protein kinase domain-containing protein n=1 Tax=Paramecium sonneborni TaxID=65129 RepID=A0A8S1RG24_9CILI|nr:unnamed protein product [Paramecium sonneborni]
MNDESDYSFELNRYEPKQMLGKGAFATVISAFDYVMRTNVAIKIVEKKMFKSKEQEDAIRQEAMTLQTLFHRNIIQILDFIETKQKFYIVMNQVDGVTLENYIPKLQQNEVIPITKQILNALSYLHQKNIVHRDIKPENILISVSGGELLVILIDFGLSASVNRIEEGLMNKNCGTLLYQAPELIKKTSYTRSVDIWALGIVVYNMLYNGEHPLYKNGDTKIKYADKIKSFSLNFKMNEDQNAKNFLERTIAYLPEYRLTADQCLEHPWITGKGDISIPFTLNEIIQCQVKKEQKIAKFIKMFVFMRYLIIRQNDMKTDEINEIGSSKDNVSMIGSELSMSQNSFRIRPLLMIKSQTKFNKLWNNNNNDSSTSNSFVGNSSRNTTDMIPEIQVNKPSFVKKQLRKSNSINPEEMINKLIRNQNCLQKEIQQKNRRVIQKDNKISKKVLTEPQDQLSRYIINIMLKFFRQANLFKPQFMRRYDQANSPLHLALGDTSELRTKLFPEKRRIPGRKGKIIIAIGILFQVWGIMHIVEVRRQFRRKEMELKKMQRKSLPFYQAMQDIRYLAAEDKRNILIEELFADHGSDYIKQITDIYFQKDIWVPFKKRSAHQYTRATKDPYPYFDIPGSRFLHGYDVYNI